MVGLAQMFALIFVMLGPLKVLGPFVHRTQGIDEAKVRGIAVWAFAIALIASVAGGFLGRTLLANWQVSTAALLVAGGVVFFVVALRQLLEQYEPAAVTAPEPLPSSPAAAACRLVFPMILTPYGIATVIALLALSPNASRTATIIGLVVFVMLLNLLAMLYARRILVGLTVIIVLQVVGAVMAILQVALAVQLILRGFQDLGFFRA